MKMIMIVFRNSLEDHVLVFLKEHEIKGYTLLSKVAGSGETGAVAGSFASPGFNSMVLVALPEGQANDLLEKLKAFRDDLAKDRGLGKIPVRVFAFPCIQAV
jgi:nitrogen regulatory protein PII